jgi:hypothetical protein
MVQKLRTSERERVYMKVNVAQDHGRTFEDSERMRDYQLYKTVQLLYLAYI